MYYLILPSILFLSGCAMYSNKECYSSQEKIQIQQERQSSALRTLADENIRLNTELSMYKGENKRLLQKVKELQDENQKLSINRK